MIVFLWGDGMKCSAVALVLVIVMGLLAACGSSMPESGSPLIGRWAYEDVVLDFFPDFTGIERFDGQRFSFKWNVDGNMLEMDFGEDDDGSFLYDVLSHVYHDMPAESFGFYFLDDEQVLMLHDDHGDHWHFILEFVRIRD